MNNDAFDKPIKPRTALQNRAMHKYFTEIADLLNESGIAVPVFLEGLEVDYSKEMVKGVWRAIAKAKFGKDSTADFTTAELQAVYEEFNRHISRFGLHLPFPSQGNNYKEQDYNL